MATPTPVTTTRQADLPRLYAAHTAATDYYRAHRHHNHAARDYLRDRGLGAVVDHDTPWSVGLAPGNWTGLADHLRGLGYRDTELVTAGLAIRGRSGRIFDLFRNRIIFPIRNRDGHVVAFIGRTWHPSGTGDSNSPKYLNTPDTPIYTKGQELFGIHEQRDRIDASWPPVLVEGPTDTLATWLSYTHTTHTGLVALAPCGTALTETQLHTAIALPGARRFGIAVAFDGDPAGHRATDRAYQLLATAPEIVARGVLFDPGADPADLLRRPDGPARLRATLQQRAQPLIHLVLDHRLDRMLHRTPQLLHEIPGRIALARTLAPLIAEQPPATAVAALGYLTDTLHRLTEEPNDVSATLRCLTAAIADHLETTPPRELRSRSAPGPPRRQHSVAVAFPTPPTPGAADLVSTARSIVRPPILNTGRGIAR